MGGQPDSCLLEFTKEQANEIADVITSTFDRLWEVVKESDIPDHNDLHHLSVLKEILDIIDAAF